MIAMRIQRHWVDMCTYKYCCVRVVSEGWMGMGGVGLYLDMQISAYRECEARAGTNATKTGGGRLLLQSPWGWLVVHGRVHVFWTDVRHRGGRRRGRGEVCRYTYNARSRSRSQLRASGSLRLRLARRLAEQLRLLERGHTCRRRSTRHGQYEAT